MPIKFTKSKQTFQIRMPNNYTLKGVLRCTSNSSNLLILLHGLESSYNTPLFKAAETFFTKNHFAVLRFNFYGKPSERPFYVTSLQDTTHDLAIVLEHIQNKFKNIFIAAHSLGAITAIEFLQNQTNIQALCLWDPSLPPEQIFANLEDTEKRLWNKSSLLSWTNYKSLDQKMRNIKTPTQIIAAELAGAHYARTTYYEKLKSLKKYLTIKEADHNFTNSLSQNKLFSETYNWLKKSLHN